MITIQHKKFNRFGPSRFIPLPYLITIIFLAIPLLIFFDYDFWDGSLISYAQQSNNFSRMHYWLYSASLEVQFFQEKFINFISDSFNVPALLLNHLLVVLAIFTLIHEVTIIARDYLKLDEKIVLVSGLIVAIFPSLSLTVSSVLTFYVTSLAIGWYCTRKFITTNGFLRYIFLLGIVYSMEYAVLLTVSPALAFLYQVSNNNNIKLRDYRKFFNVFIILLTALIYKVTQFFINKPDGPMTGYNQIRIPINLSDITQFAYGVKSFSSFLLYPILLAIPVYLIAFIGKNLEPTSNRYISGNRLTRIAVLILFGCSILPYLIVGKSTSLFWLDFWTGRHSFALIPALALLSAVSLDFCVKSLALSKTQIKYSLILSIVGISITSTVLLERDILYKYNQQENRKSLIASLKEVSDEIKPGFIKLKIDKSKGLSMSIDESNYLMYQVKGDLKSFTLISTGSTLEDVALKRQMTTISPKWGLFEISNQRCNTEIIIERASEINKIQGFLNPKFQIKNITSSCEGATN